MWRLSLLILLVTLAEQAFSKPESKVALLQQYASSHMDRWVDSVMNSLTIDQKIGQLIMLTVNGRYTPENQKQIARWLEKTHAGGLLFSASTPIDQAQLTNYAQSLSKVPLMIALDGEWGLAMRLKNTIQFPRNMMLGAIQNDSIIYQYGAEVARQCKRMGIHINFAPTADVNNNPNNPVIGTRSFGEDPYSVSLKTVAYSRGLEDNGILSVAKHFPGHGNTDKDSHHTLPTIQTSLQELMKTEIPPFRAYINDGRGGVMIGHLSVPALDAKPNTPASLSPLIVKQMLIEDFQFKGLIFTDGLAMKGVSNQTDMSIRAILAGNDVLLGPVNPIREWNNLKRAWEEGKITTENIDRRCRKILQFKYAFGLHRYAPVDTQNLMQDLNTPHAEELNETLHQQAITLLKNENQTFPLYPSSDRKKIAVISLSDTANELAALLSKHFEIKNYSVQNANQLAEVLSKVQQSDKIILNIATQRGWNENMLIKLANEKPLILSFATSPYVMQQYTSLIGLSEVVLCSYQNTTMAQRALAQSLVGINAVNAKLPVSVAPLFPIHSGVEAVSSKLQYADPQKVGLQSTQIEKIDSIVLSGISQKAYPGCQVLVARKGYIVYNKSFGFHDYSRKRATTNTDLYDLASITKIAAVLPAIMKLYDENKISLQEPLSRYIPELKGTDKKHISVMEALTHQSGLPPFIPFFLETVDSSSFTQKLFTNRRTLKNTVEYSKGYWGNPSFLFKKEFISTQADTLYPYQVAHNLFASNRWRDVMRDKIIRVPLRTKSRSIYSDLNFILLQMVIENITNMTIDNYLRSNIYQPIGIERITYTPLSYFTPENIVPTERDRMFRKQLLHGYVHDEMAALMGGVAGNAGLFGSAFDLAQLAQMWLNGGVYNGKRVLSQSTCKAFLHTLSPVSSRGLGFDTVEITDKNGASHRVLGHSGFTGTCLWIDPQQQIIFIFLSNRVYPSRSDNKLARMKIRTHILEQIYSSFM